MPDVTGKALDLAMSDIERAGFTNEVEVVGGGLFGVVDESNWEVCEQLPRAGAPMIDPPRLTVERSCRGGTDPGEADSTGRVADADAESEEATEGGGSGEAADGSATALDGSQSPPPKEPSASDESSDSPDALTVENSQDMAALMAGPSYGDSVEAFVEEHHLETISLDGHITFLIDSERVTYSTASVVVGDSGSPLRSGPTFEFTPATMSPNSPIQPDDLREGQNIRLTALVGSYYSFEESSTFKPERDTRVVLVDAYVDLR